MKSVVQAERTFKHICNTSASKYQYSFGRDQRFKNRAAKSHFGETFYQMPSQISKLGSTFGKSKRDCQKSNKTEGPSPSNYNPKAVQSKGKIIFAPGRDQCKVESVFYNTKIDYPGPGTYKLNEAAAKRAYSMMGKRNVHYQTDSPGPKYNFGSTLLERNKILSNQTKKGSMKIILPTSKRRLQKSSDNDQRSFSQSVAKTQGIINRKGDKPIGTSGGNLIPKQSRFKTVSFQTLNPGPGYYDTFSQFIHTKIK